MVPPLPARISRFFFGSKTLLVLLLLIISRPSTTRRHHGTDCCGIGGRLSFVADAFSPSYLVISPQQRYQNQRQLQQQQQNSIRIAIIRPLYASIPYFTVDIGDDGRLEETDEDTSPAFLIESISKSPSGPSGDTIFKTISNMCIDVFFKELLDPSGKGNVNILKEWQINYLKTLQAADLERRRDRYGDTNEMFLAYEVKRSTGMADVLSQPLLLDEELKGAYNMDSILSSRKEGGGRKMFIVDDDDSNCYVRGNLLGFVEITQKPYGLGGAAAAPAEVQSSSSSSEETVTTTASAAAADDFSFNNGQQRPMRPVLTNLAVSKAARQYGIGSKLLDACEQHVRKGWKMNEIVLEVEDYNTKGLAFYRQRGYEVLFSDPASRRYDIEGFWLNKVRCRREIMRKVFINRPISLMESADNMIRRFRETVSNF